MGSLSARFWRGGGRENLFVLFASADFFALGDVRSQHGNIFIDLRDYASELSFLGSEFFRRSFLSFERSPPRVELRLLLGQPKSALTIRRAKLR